MRTRLILLAFALPLAVRAQAPKQYYQNTPATELNGAEIIGPVRQGGADKSTTTGAIAGLVTPGGIGGLAAANNLSDLSSATTALVNLGLGGAAVLNVGSTAGSVADGGALTAASSAAAAAQATANAAIPAASRNGANGVPGTDAQNTISGQTATPFSIVSGAVTRTLAAIFGDHDNALNHGVKGDGQQFSKPLTIAAGGYTLHATTGVGVFASAVPGQLIFIAGAGAAGAELATSIASVQGPQDVTLASPASTALTASTQTVTFGTDDAAAINAWLALIKATTPTAFGINAHVEFPRNRVYVVSSASINLTLVTNLTISARGSLFYGATTGAAVIDAMGAYRLTASDFNIQGDATLVPTVAFQTGRYSTVSAYGRSDFNNIKAAGSFSISACYLMASETTHVSSMECSKSNAGGYAFINDGTNHFGLTSQYLAIQYNSSTNPNGLQPDVGFTNTDDTILDLKAVGSSGSTGGMWTSGAESHKYINAYTYSPGACAWTIWANVSSRTTDVEWSGTMEGPPTVDVCFTGNGSAGTNVTAVDHFILHNGRDLATVTDFSADASFAAGGVKLTGADITQPSINVLMWDTPATYAYQGSFTFGSSTNFVVPTGSGSSFYYTNGLVKTTVGTDSGLASGQLLAIGGCTPGASSVGCIGGPSGSSTGTSSFGVGFAYFADTYGKFAQAVAAFSGVNGSGQAGRTELLAATASTTPAIMTANNSGTPGVTNIVNCTTLGKQAMAVRMTITALDTITQDMAIWTAGPFAFQCNTASLSSARLPNAVTFTQVMNTGGGSLASAPVPTIAANTTDGGQAVTVTATGTNAVHWVDVVDTVEVK